MTQFFSDEAPLLLGLLGPAPWPARGRSVASTFARRWLVLTDWSALCTLIGLMGELELPPLTPEAETEIVAGADRVQRRGPPFSGCEGRRAGRRYLIDRRVLSGWAELDACLPIGGVHLSRQGVGHPAGVGHPSRTIFARLGVDKNRGVVVAIWRAAGIGPVVRNDFGDAASAVNIGGCAARRSDIDGASFQYSREIFRSNVSLCRTGYTARSFWMRTSVLAAVNTLKIVPPRGAPDCALFDRKAKKYVMRYRVDRCVFCAQCKRSCPTDAVSFSDEQWELAALDRTTFDVYYGKDEDVQAVLAESAGLGWPRGLG